MKVHWYLTLLEGLVTGLIFCECVMAVLRINPAMFTDDLPNVAKQELLALDLSPVSTYELVLGLSLMHGPILWRGFRLMSKLKPKILGLKKHLRFLSLYVHLVIWIFIVTNMDLIVLDWLIIGFLKAPILGIEHLLSDTAIQSYQSYYFHFEEHYLFYGTYLVNILFPILFIFIFTIFKGSRKLLKNAHDSH